MVSREKLIEQQRELISAMQGKMLEGDIRTHVDVEASNILHRLIDKLATLEGLPLGRAE